MSSSRFKNLGVVLLTFAMLLVVACHKKVAPPPAAAAPAPPPPTPPPPPPAPTITLRANPTTINRGQSTTLQWEARNAQTVRIEPGLGDVQATGNRSVNPASSVTYSATATGPGGEARDTARITVNIPAPPPAAPPPPVRPPDVGIEELFRQNVKDIYFDFDKSDIKPDQVSVLQSNATWLKSNASRNARFTIEGNCDERGSAEYNIGLGDRRANAAKEFLVSQGVAADRIMTVSYGKERPVCTEANEDCYMRNRHDHFTPNR
jgi:peptidoglycan-associated lipoprotein